MSGLWRNLELKQMRHPHFNADATDLDLAPLQRQLQQFFPAMHHARIIRNHSEKPLQRAGHIHTDKTEILLPIEGEIKVELHSTNGCGEEYISEITSPLVIFPEAWHRIVLMPHTTLLAFATRASKDEHTELPCSCKMARSA